MPREPGHREPRESGVPKYNNHLPSERDRTVRQPYAAEVDDYAGEKAAPPEQVPEQGEGADARQENGATGNTPDCVCLR